MKVIQIRGTNAVGKTTAVREFIKHGDFIIRDINVNGKIIECHWEEERKIAIIGRYDKAATGGVDSCIQKKELLNNTIVKIIKTFKPDVLIFEGIMYGVTFEFAYKLVRVLKALHYDYVGLCFFPSLDVVFERLAQRNGGKEVDYMSIQGKWFSAQKAYEKLKANGINVKSIDNSKIPKELMYKIIEEEL